MPRVDKKYIKLGVVALAVVALVIGLSVGLTQKNKSATTTSASSAKVGGDVAAAADVIDFDTTCESKSGKSGGSARRKLVVPGTEELNDFDANAETGKRRRLRDEMRELQTTSTEMPPNSGQSRSGSKSGKSGSLAADGCDDFTPDRCSLESKGGKSGGSARLDGDGSKSGKSGGEGSARLEGDGSKSGKSGGGGLSMDGVSGSLTMDGSKSGKSGGAGLAGSKDGMSGSLTMDGSKSGKSGTMPGIALAPSVCDGPEDATPSPNNPPDLLPPPTEFPTPLLFPDAFPTIEPTSGSTPTVSTETTSDETSPPRPSP